MIDLDPRDPKAAGHENPLAQYLTVPNGIGVVAAIQVLFGILFAYTAISQHRSGASGVHVGSLVALAALFLVVGVGFWRCRAWAWWALAAIFSFLAVNTIAELVRDTGSNGGDYVVFLVVAFVAEGAILFYIYRDFVVRYMSFRRPPGRVMRFSPLVAGAALAIAALMRVVR